MLLIKNITSYPILLFILGFSISFITIRPLHSWIKGPTSYAILLLIGFKGGLYIHSFLPSDTEFFRVICLLILWGLIQPFLCFYILRKATSIDTRTLVVVATSFGSVSVMTFLAGTSFLDQIQIFYRGVMFSALAILEIPGIVAGIFLAFALEPTSNASQSNLRHAISHAILNRAVGAILVGLVFGFTVSYVEARSVESALLFAFKLLLAIFMLQMGYEMGCRKRNLSTLSWNLGCLVIAITLLSGAVGLLFSRMLALDPGTSTLVCTLCASASYIAVPATMRVVIPQANETVYVAISLGIVFPFNLLVGIPIYYSISSWVLI